MTDNPRACPPPKGFIQARNIAWTEAANRPNNIAEKRRGKGKLGEGIRYERKGHLYLAREFPGRYVPGPWFTWQSGLDHPHFCQPDGLIFDTCKGRITICEFKLKHTSTAWWQLRKLYRPIVERNFGTGWNYRIVEITKWFDPYTAFPERVTFTPSLLTLGDDKFYVHIWKG